MKKFGGTIKNWQIHTLSLSQEKIDEVYPGENATPFIVTGTVVEVPGNRQWRPGYHMRSSLIVKIDRENNTIETLNTIYNLTGEEGADVLPDLGDAVSNVFY